MGEIKTFQDLIAIGEIEKDRMQFDLDAINEHKARPEYKIAVDGELYYQHQNPTIMKYQKYL